MRLEIRDLEDTTLYEIGPDGAILGRERAKTDISLRDESVSKRHARIFSDEGIWLLEDLNSSNGTYIDEQRITGPVPISQGSVFALAQRKFEVVYIEGANEYPPPSLAPHLNVNGGLGPPRDSGGFHAMTPPSDDLAPHAESADLFDENRGVGAVLAAPPKATAYYMVNVPLMLVNPLGTIRKASEEQPVEPMSNVELAAFAIPAGAMVPLVGAVFAALALLVNGTFSVAPIMGALVSAAIGGAIAAVVGFFLHPILEFLVRLLKGTSDPRSRTNYGVQVFTFSIVAALPQGVGVFLAALPVPLIRLAGPLLLMLVTLVSLFLAYRWVVTFQLADWMRYVVLTLGGVVVLGAVVGLVQGALAELSAPPTPAASPGLIDGDVVGASSSDVKAAQGSQVSPDAVQRGLGAAGAKAAEAERRANVGGSPPRTRMSAEAPPPLRTSPSPSSGAPVPPSISDEAVRAGSIVASEHPLGETPFVRFLAKRTAIERAMNDKPELLERRALRKNYERLWRKTYSIREKYRRKRGDRWKREKIHTRRKDQEIFEATQKDVDQLYQQIFP